MINAARVLASRPRSKVALENMDVFKDAWENQVRLLTDTVDDITTIDDFLAVSGIGQFQSIKPVVFAKYTMRHKFSNFFQSKFFYDQICESF